MKRLLLALLIVPCAASCKHSSATSITAHTETSTTTDSTSSESGATTTTTTVTEAPGTTTTTVSEYGPPEKEEPGSSEDSEARPQGVRLEPPASVNAGLPRKVPRHGPLVKRTVTVTRSGGETTQSRTEATQQATGATETKAAGKVDTQAQAQTASAPSAGCVGASWIWGLAALAFAGLVIFGIVRMRRA